MVKQCQSFSHVQLFENPWARQVPLCMEFSRKEYWSRLSFSSPGDFPNRGIEPRSPTLRVDSLLFEPPGRPNRGSTICWNRGSKFDSVLELERKKEKKKLDWTSKGKSIIPVNKMKEHSRIKSHWYHFKPFLSSEISPKFV